MLASEFFTKARLKEMRQEIVKDGFIVDPFLSGKPNCPVFGLNLTCAYPFPAHVLHFYEPLAADLATLDSSAFVYPRRQTHITIVTFINFAHHQFPKPELLASFNELAEQIIFEMDQLFKHEVPMHRFFVDIERPIISSKAIILPMSDELDLFSLMRSRVEAKLKSHPVLYVSLKNAGLNIPRIVHSTILRFKSVPADPKRFLESFDQIARSVTPTSLQIENLAITAEIQPYMRDAEILRDFRLEF